MPGEHQPVGVSLQLQSICKYTATVGYSILLKINKSEKQSEREV